MKKLSLLLVLALVVSACKQATPNYPRFDETTYYVGTNFWYGAILASEGQGGDRKRLNRELDQLQKVGIDNLRVLVGADGMPGVNAKVEPCLQLAPGVYNDTILDGLDYLMAELERRGMKAVLFLNNSWEWSGGYSQYLGWAKDMHWPTPQEVGYPTYMASCAEWSRCDSAQALFYDHVRFILSRTNRYTQRPYTESPAIFSWQIGNEPRAFADDVKPQFAEWIHRTAQLIKSIDPNHMVSTGSEGIWGCEMDSDLCMLIHSYPEIDYITCHIWPYNWSWMDVNDMEGTIDQAIANTRSYLEQHVRIAEQLQKPLIVEEFGFPRDEAMWKDGACSPTTIHYRDIYYRELFQEIILSRRQHGLLRGCNFWGWGGEAEPQHQQWQPGDPYTGDPAQEDQGLNSVFLADSTTLEIIRSANMVVNPTRFRPDLTLNIRLTDVLTDIPSTMYGIFFEDINYGADGGLYAEMIKNRSFEFNDPMMGWKVQGRYSILDDGPFERCPHYIRLMGKARLSNEGYFHMGFKEGEAYNLSVWARSANGKPTAFSCAIMNDAEDVPVDASYIIVDSDDWKRYTIRFIANKTVNQGFFGLIHDDGGQLDLEHISLFPADTWNGDENGLRRDMVECLNDLKPGVFRFPGGCIVEGNTLPTRYQWKLTVGPVENRPTNVNRWQEAMPDRPSPDYYQSGGLGFFEYFRLAEELGAEPLPVINCGMACEFANDPSTIGPWLVPTDEMQPYVQDAIDLIEFANGDPNTNEWARVRAEMGHPLPFNLKYLAIGNEQWGEFYTPRFRMFQDAIRKKYPDIKLIGTAGPFPEGDEFNRLWSEMRRVGADLVDEHFYNTEEWFLNNASRYDAYPREGSRVFAGEYCCHSQGSCHSHNHFSAALAEAALMTGFERNADVVRMATYAPLFAHVEGWQWRPDMIWFDNLRSVRTASYYVQQLFSTNCGTDAISALVGGQPLAGKQSQMGLFATASFDRESGDIIIKMVNIEDKCHMLCLEIPGLKGQREARLQILRCDDPDAENTIDNPNLIAPYTVNIAVNLPNSEMALPSHSVAVLRIHNQL